MTHEDLAHPWRAICSIVGLSAGRVPKDAPFRDDGGLFMHNLLSASEKALSIRVRRGHFR